MKIKLIIGSVVLLALCAVFMSGFFAGRSYTLNKLLVTSPGNQSHGSYAVVPAQATTAEGGGSGSSPSQTQPLYRQEVIEGQRIPGGKPARFISTGQATFDTDQRAWLFNDGLTRLRLSPTSKSEAIVETVVEPKLSLTVQVTTQRPCGRAIQTDVQLWDITRGTDGTLRKKVPLESWQIALLSPVKQGPAAVEWKSSVGFGTSIAAWDQLAPCVTYSPIRLWRLRPAVMLDTASRAGPGVQMQVWKPIWLGAFATWSLKDLLDKAVGSDPSLDDAEARLTATINF